MNRSKPRIALDLRGLVGADEIFRLPGGVRRDAAVDAWLNGKPLDLRSIARDWFMRMRMCGDDVLELLHDGCPVACVEDAPFAYVNSFKGHVNVGFYRGAKLNDPAGLLLGSGKLMRHVKVVPGGVINTSALGDLITAAYLDIRNRLA